MTIPNPATTDWVPIWDTGATGGGAGSIPGEIKMWSGASLPAARYGKWVWADGAIYDEATYPEAAANIHSNWKTAHGAADPGAGKFRVPDLRGLTPMGMDAMPGGADAGRMSRATTIAAKSGEEYHTLAAGEMPSHSHTVNSHSHGGATGTISADHAHYTGAHTHSIRVGVRLGFGIGSNSGDYYQQDATGGQGDIIQARDAGWSGGVNTNHTHAVTAEAPGTNAQGGGGSHENLPPTVFVPYIVRLDG